jgi:hypothetical protein
MVLRQDEEQAQVRWRASRENSTPRTHICEIWSVVDRNGPFRFETSRLGAIHVNYFGNSDLRLAYQLQEARVPDQSLERWIATKSRRIEPRACRSLQRCQSVISALEL